MTDRYDFRPARLTDVVAIGRILDDAVARMLSEGKTQWNENYPTEMHVLADMTAGNAYVIERAGRVLAYGAVILTGEEAYNHLRGEWISDKPYVVIHRMAVAREAQRQGVARRFFQAVERFATRKEIMSIRVDTNFDNDRMLRLLESAGFEYCGEVSYASGGRMAFEKTL